MTQTFQRAIGDGIVPAAHFEVAKLRHAPDVQYAFVRERCPLEFEVGDVVERRQELEGAVGETSRELADAVLLDDVEDRGPIAFRLGTPNGQLILIPVDGVEGRPLADEDGRGSRIAGWGVHTPGEGGPIGEAVIAGHHRAHVRDFQAAMHLADFMEVATECSAVFRIDRTNPIWVIAGISLSQVLDEFFDLFAGFPARGLRCGVSASPRSRSRSHGQ